MKPALLDLNQRRMDRCQSEQLWAIAVYAGVNAFVISESDKFVGAFARCHLLWSLGVIGALTLVFVYERMDGYYRYRNDNARLLADEKDADEVSKKPRGILNPNGIIWIIVFAIAVCIPLLATVKITALKKANPAATAQHP